MQELDESHETITIASPSIMELISGSYQANLANDRDNILRFAETWEILGFGKEEAIEAGDIEADLLESGDMIDTEDIMIAAIAKHHGDALITSNAKHFERIKGLKIAQVSNLWR